MKPALYRLPKNHKEIFGDNIPVTMSYMMRVLFDYWEVANASYIKMFREPCIDSTESGLDFSKEIDEFFRNCGGLFLCRFFEENLVSEEKKKKFMETYVEYFDYKFLFGENYVLSRKDIKNIVSSLKAKVHRRLLLSIRKNGIINPLTIIGNSSGIGGSKIVLEGKHRASISALFGIKRIPCFVVNRIHEDKSISGWWVTFREFAKIANSKFESAKNEEEFEWKE